MPQAIVLSPEDWQKQHDEVSRAINKLLLVLIGFCFFCALALGAPDRELLASDAQITLPFANAQISFVSFLVIAPLILTALSLYLHIFVGYWTALSGCRPASSSSDTSRSNLPFVFNLPYRTATWLSDVLFYWLVPITLSAFVWKTLPRSESSRLIVLASAFVMVFLFLQIRRRPPLRSKFSSAFLWMLLLFSIVGTAYVALSKGFTPLHRQLRLRKADLRNQDLRFVNFVGAQMEEADLAGADLAFAQLNGAYLYSANLKGAKLHHADLTGAVLSFAQLKGADLSDAALRGAYLTSSDLTGGDLTGADLTKAILEGADLKAAHLSRADLNYARYLTQNQVNEAKGDQLTRLPTGIVRPRSWNGATAK